MHQGIWQKSSNKPMYRKHNTSCNITGWYNLKFCYIFTIHDLETKTPVFIVYFRRHLWFFQFVHLQQSFPSPPLLFYKTCKLELYLALNFVVLEIDNLIYLCSNHIISITICGLHKTSIYCPMSMMLNQRKKKIRKCV